MVDFIENLKESKFWSLFILCSSYLFLVVLTIILLETIPQLNKKPEPSNQWLLIIPTGITALFVYTTYDSVKEYRKSKYRKNRKNQYSNVYEAIKKKRFEIRLFIAISLFFLSLTLILGYIIRVSFLVDFVSFLTNLHMNSPWLLFPYVNIPIFRFLVIFLIWDIYLFLITFIITYSSVKKEITDFLEYTFDKYLDVSFVETDFKKYIMINEKINVTILLSSTNYDIVITSLSIEKQQFKILEEISTPIIIEQNKQRKVSFEVEPRSAYNTQLAVYVIGYVASHIPNRIKKKIYTIQLPMKSTKKIPIMIYPLQPELDLEISNPEEINLDERITVHFKIRNVGKGATRDILISLPESNEFKIIQNFDKISLLPSGETRNQDLIVEISEEGFYQIPFVLSYTDKSSNKIKDDKSLQMIEFEVLKVSEKPISTKIRSISIKSTQKTTEFEFFNLTIEQKKVNEIRNLWEEFSNNNMERALQIDENEYFDRKQEMPNVAKLEETIVAMANTVGGIIVFGISDKKVSYPLSDKKRDTISNTITSICSKNIQPPIKINFHNIIEAEDNGYLIVLIPRYIDNRFSTQSGKILKRVGSQNVPLTHKEMKEK